MDKRGQFFLFAAFLISIILFSLGIVFNSAPIIRENNLAENIADEMSYEASELLNHEYIQGKQADSESNILKLSDSFASNYKNAEIIIVYGLGNPVGIKARYYKQGSGEDYILKTKISENTIKVDYEDQTYEFIKHNGYNYFVIVKIEGPYGKYISVK